MKTPRVNECGHPERKHYAKGMCELCYRSRPEMHALRLAISVKYDRKRFVDPEYREAKRLRNAVWYAANKDRAKELNRKWRAANKEHRNARQRELRAAKKAAKEPSKT